ncbi:hypothetical protein [Microvirga makkahensis]|uniref:Fibrinogen-binding protein n=1 Tax=Microvirga makkahensis TaxID=1128670 RepID=A0A7X3MP98_9HYPH|nr:hypothetical protein [Microvirga makkahensis]MXQ10719.1 hypothetical protein [Microvirga makkahensis]
MGHPSSDARNTNSGSVAAALGVAVAVDDIENVGNDTGSYNESNSHNNTEYKTVTVNEVENKTVNVSDDDIRDSNNTSNSNNTLGVDIDVVKTETESKVEDSYNDIDVSKTETEIEGSYNTKTETEIEDSYNTKTETEIEDSYNTKNETEIEDSYNSLEVDISKTVSEIEDSYNSDDDWLELDGLDFDVLTAIGDGVLTGSGNDAMFNIAQVSELKDNDTLYRAEVENDARFEQDANSDGGYARGGDDFDDRATATASADGVANLEAFTQNIVMGANIQYNGVDMSVVGGNSSIDDADVA